MRDPQFFLRMFARGDFPSQIEELGKQIAERAPLTSERAQLRVLLLHHSIAYKGRRRFLEISADTQRLLRAAIERFEIGVVLSGHIHEPQVNDLGNNTYEIRCGTTAQDQKSLPRFLETWTLKKSQLREALLAWPELRSTLVANFLREQKKENIYLEHSVSRANDGRIIWEVMPYTRWNRGGFKPAEGLMPRGPFTPRLARAA